MRTFRFKDSSFFDMFSSPIHAKRRLITPIMKRFPKRKFILVGDTGEKDPEVYGEFAREFEGQVKAIFIRRAPEKEDIRSTSTSLGHYQSSHRNSLSDSWLQMGAPLKTVVSRMEGLESEAADALLKETGIEVVREDEEEESAGEESDRDEAMGRHEHFEETERLEDVSQPHHHRFLIHRHRHSLSVEEKRQEIEKDTEKEKEKAKAKEQKEERKKEKKRAREQEKEEKAAKKEKKKDTEQETDEKDREKEKGAASAPGKPLSREERLARENKRWEVAFKGLEGKVMWKIFDDPEELASIDLQQLLQ